MKKIDIFKEIIRIMTNDSSTKKDIKGKNPDLFLNEINEEMFDDEFYYLVRSYLASFGIIGHVAISKKELDLSFLRLKYYNGLLYVIDSDAETNLLKGDQITYIDGLSIHDFYLKHKLFFVQTNEERQYMDWSYFVKKSKQITICRNFKEVLVIYQPVSNEKKRILFESKWIENDIFYMRMDNFFEEDKISQLYKECEQALSSAEYLIIDVRHNQGGSDSLYFPLFKYALPEGKGFNDLNIVDDFDMEILYTPFNTEQRLISFTEQLNDPATSQETKDLINNFKEELITNEEKGYVRYPSDISSFLPELKGISVSPKQIFLLSDVYCGSSGENFVEMMKWMPKVTVVGRATMGILDYSNCSSVEFADYILTYPTSRSLSIDVGKGMTNKGVIPDIEIPWTQKHLTEDIDLKYIIDLIKDEKGK